MERTAAVLMVLAVVTACGGGVESDQTQVPAAAEGRGVILVQEAEAFPIEEATGTYGIYMKINNDGAMLDRLVEATIDRCDATELQETTNENGAVRVTPVVGGIVIPPHSTLVLGPGAVAVTCLGIAADVSEGDTLEVTLIFEQAGAQTVNATVTSEL